jgi:toxin-antitoxin system PIN domain toxin
MIAVDTNLLVYAHRRDSAFHAPAAACLRGLAEGLAGWAIPWPCVYEFWNVATHPRIFAPPSTPEQALAQLEAWMSAPGCHLLGDLPGQRPALRQLVDAAVRGPLVHDARIALVCQAHGVETLWSVDRDFSRFPWLTVRNPLT